MRNSVFFFDDDPSILETFRAAHSDEYDIRTALTLNDARRLLTVCAADIIISDQTMPEIDGAVFLREAAGLCPDSFRILVSGYGRVSDVLNELGSGIINIFVSKPWTPEYMRRVLERASMTLATPVHRLRPEDERRIAPRLKVRLETRVLMIATTKGAAAGGQELLLSLGGYTSDVSQSGLGLIVSGTDQQALTELGPDYLLRLMLTLPEGSIELTVTPVRYQRLGERDEYLIGTEITDMSGRDRVRFMEFIRDLTGGDESQRPPIL